MFVSSLWQILKANLAVGSFTSSNFRLPKLHWKRRHEGQDRPRAPALLRDETDEQFFKLKWIAAGHLPSSHEPCESDKSCIIEDAKLA
jgi:hypothetical protein